MTVCYSTCL